MYYDLYFFSYIYFFIHLAFIHLADAFIQSAHIEEYNRRYIIKRQTDTGSACNTNF